MARARVQNDLKHGCYFLTPTIRNWYYIFDRHDRWNILADSLKFFQKNKGLEIFSYVFMLNHIHLIVTSEDVSGFLRDFKSFTSKQLKKNIQKHEHGEGAPILKFMNAPRFQKWFNAKCIE